MITVKSAEFLITIIAYLIAYVCIVPIVGCFQAWVAEKMGDSGPADRGYLTLNPMAHLDFTSMVGFLCLVFVGVGWGETVKINPLNIHGKFRGLKLVCAFFADTFAHVILATLAITGLIILYGPYVINLSVGMMLSGNLSHEQFSNAFPDSSSLAITISLILVASIYLNVLLAVFDMMYRAMEWMMAYIIEHAPEYAKYNNLAFIFVFILLATMFIIPQLRIYLVMTIAYWGYALAYLLGFVI